MASHTCVTGHKLVYYEAVACMQLIFLFLCSRVVDCCILPIYRACHHICTKKQC